MTVPAAFATRSVRGWGRADARDIRTVINEFGGGFSADGQWSALFAGTWNSNGSVTWDDVPFGTNDDLSLADQEPTTDIALGPGLFVVRAWANFSTLGDATAASASLYVSNSVSQFTTSAGGVYIAGLPAPGANLDVSTTILIENGSTGSVTLFTADDSSMTAPTASDMELWIQRIVDLS